MAHGLARVLRAALLGLIATLALSVHGARAEDQVFTIPDYAKARENLTPRHAQAWRIYEYYRINRAKQQAAIDEHDFLRREVEDVAPGGLLAGLALSQERLGEMMQAANARRAEAEAELSKAEKVWSNNNFDVAIGHLGEDGARMITVRHEDPDRPGQFITRQMNRIEYRLYNGKSLGIFTAADKDPVDGTRPAPADVAPTDVADPVECPPCPQGKELCYCDPRTGQPLCYDPSRGEGCLMPTDREACTGPDCVTPGAAGGITSILRGK